MYAFLAGLCCAAAILILAAASPSLAKKPSADAQFKALYTKEWKWRDDQFPGGEDNTKEIADHLPKADAATQEMRLRYWEDTLKALDAIPRAKLSPANQVNYDVYRPQLEVLIANQKFREYEAPANSDTTFWTDLGYVARQDFKKQKDYQNWIAQMRDIPRYFREQMEVMRAGPEARLHAAAGDASGARRLHHQCHQREARRVAVLHAVQDHARHRARPAGSTACTGRRRDQKPGAAGLCRAA